MATAKKPSPKREKTFEEAIAEGIANGASIDGADIDKFKKAIVSDAYRKHNGMMKRRFPT